MQGVFVCQTGLKLSGKVNECKPLPTTRATRSWRSATTANAESSQQSPTAPWRQGLKLVHFSAQRKHILWDRLTA